MGFETIAYVAAIFLLAGTVKGVVGLGLPTISMGLLALSMAPAQAAALLIVPTVLTNIWQAGPMSTLMPLLKRLGPMQWAIAAGTLGGALVFGAPAGLWASGALGAALVVYALWGLWGATPIVSSHTERWLGPVSGFLTGIITAVTGVVVIPAVPYLQALALDKQALIQSMGLSFSVATIALGLGLWMNQSYSVHHLGVSTLMLIPALLGMMLGSRLRGVLSPSIFRRLLLLSLLALGLYQVVRALNA